MNRKLQNQLRSRSTAWSGIHPQSSTRRDGGAAGQFDLAKVLRALAHTQRVQAMTAARVLAQEMDPARPCG